MVLPAFAHIACIILCLAIACCLFGVAIGRLLHWRWISQQGPGFSAVIGLAGGLLFLEVFNLFCPVNHVAVAVLGSLILCSMILFRRSFVEVMRNWLQNRNALSTALLLLLLVIVSLFGLGPLESLHYDTGLYYLNAIRWAHAYPAVPGLANLHTRLGYNQSLFLFVAFLSSLVNLGLARACQVANPIIVFVSGWAILDRLRLNLGTATAKRVRLYAILLLCPLFFFATHIFVSTPTGDIAAAVLALPGALAFFCCLEMISDRAPDQARNWLVLLTVCGCSVVKLKLSYAALMVGAVGIAAMLLLVIQPRAFFWSWIRAGVFAAGLLVPWAARSVILSGYPFYPSTLIRFRMDWAVPRAYADSDSRWISSWARWPEKDPESVLKNNDWLVPWVERNAKEPEKIFLFFFVIAGLVSALLSLLTPMSREHRLITVFLIAQSLLALTFWFKTAPDPRFGYATLLLLGVNGFYAFTGAIARLSNIRSSFFACVITSVSVCFIFRNEWPLLNDYPMKFPQGFPKAELRYRTTDSGLKVGIPKDEKAWDSGLVVTPQFDRHLTLRDYGLRNGFRTKFDSNLDSAAD